MFQSLKLQYKIKLQPNNAAIPHMARVEGKYPTKHLELMIGVTLSCDV